jgi:hypothetical protein
MTKHTLTVALQCPMKSPIVRFMNAAEIIAEIARLPEDEKGKVVDFVRHAHQILSTHDL